MIDLTLTKRDMHVHTHFSHDVPTLPETQLDAIAQAAIEKGLSQIAICDHCDFDIIKDGLCAPYQRDAIQREILSAKEKYEGRLKILWGIELGQAHAFPNEAKALITSCPFDYVLGSLHALRDNPDLCYLNYEKLLHSPAVLKDLTKKVISEMTEIAALPYLDTLAHITYIGRYIAEVGGNFDFLMFEKEWRALFHILIENGTALEVNTSGMSAGRPAMPDADLIRLYFDCGGKDIVLGSDAHRVQNVGASFDAAYARIESCRR